MMLDAARQRAISAGVAQPECRQRHGDLVETLRDLQDETRLLVVGRQGEDSGDAIQHIGSQLESVIRTMHRPILVTVGEFSPPRSLMLAFDGSATTLKGIEMLASSPLFQGMPIHLVMVGNESDEARTQLDAARDALAAGGLKLRNERMT
jgi:hypothetical protein